MRLPEIQSTTATFTVSQIIGNVTANSLRVGPTPSSCAASSISGEIFCSAAMNIIIYGPI
ncbi:hypothetical protein D3C86_2076270 [compost metagenome]